METKNTLQRMIRSIGRRDAERGTTDYSAAPWNAPAPVRAWDGIPPATAEMDLLAS